MCILYDIELLKFKDRSYTMELHLKIENGEFLVAIFKFKSFVNGYLTMDDTEATDLTPINL